MKSIQFEPPRYKGIRFPVIIHEDYLSQSRRSIYANWHAGIEILCFRQGSVHILLDADRVCFGPGDTAIIRSNVIHTIVAESTDCLYDCLIVEAAFLEQLGFPVRQMLPAHIADDTVPRLVRAIRKDFEERPPLYEQSILAAVVTIFTHLYRAYPNGNTAPDEPFASQKHRVIAQALTFIGEHLSGRLTIQDVCTHVGVSKYYFCRVFRAYTDLSFVQYVNQMRCVNARQLMLVHGYSVSQAAREMGFDNPSYFSRLYKQYMGKLPSREKPDA